MEGRAGAREGEGARAGARQKGEGGAAEVQGGSAAEGGGCGQGGGREQDSAAGRGAPGAGQGATPNSHAVLLPAGAAPRLHALRARTLRLRPWLRAQSPQLQGHALSHDAELPW